MTDGVVAVAEAKTTAAPSTPAEALADGLASARTRHPITPTVADAPPPMPDGRDASLPTGLSRDVPLPTTPSRDASPPTILLRDVPTRAAWALEQAGTHPLLARLFAARGIRGADELDDGLARLLPPDGLLGVPAAARLLADSLATRRRICVVADYDCDGATACAVALRGLALLGAAPGSLSYVVPDRARHGYGLTPAIVDLALAQGAELLLTVDNGIASIEGVAHARAAGVAVLVTDHHLPALLRDDAVPLPNREAVQLPAQAAVQLPAQAAVQLPAQTAVQLPDADVIVNPNQPACGFASKHLAGVGVVFYVLLGLRAELRQRGAFGADAQPRLDSLLDLVALGTVADVVRLDANNRRLVAQGLKRIRAGRLQPGLAALFAVAGRDWRQAGAFDFGFALGPRINAAGRLSDMTLGIECLLTDDATRAAELAAVLDTINRQRREVEAGMREQAEAMVDRLLHGGGGSAASSLAGLPPPALALYDAGFHEGVVGIVASRLKERLHRPAFVFARGRDGLLKGSGRSIAGFHLRDALDLVAKRHPGLLIRFGGHAMAAGCTLAESGFAAFDAALQQVARERLDRATLERKLLSDGPLGIEYFNVETVRSLDAQVWGPAFEAPLFSDAVEVVSQRLVGERHLKLCVKHAGVLRDAIWFGRTEPLPARVRLTYRLCVDSYEGRQRLQMVVEAAG